MDKLNPIRSRPLRDPSFSINGFSMSPAPDSARFVLRARGAAVDAAGSALGLELPRNAFGTGTAGTRSALWLGPDEWLLLASQSEGAAIERQLSEALDGTGHSLVDVSHRDVALTAWGPKTADVLNTGCPLDLHPSVFSAAMCTRTLLGKAEIVLWRFALESFHVQSSRSFAGYVWRFLEQAARDVIA
jgi:sarcosine oxidase, subunit gamma